MGIALSDYADYIVYKADKLTSLATALRDRDILPPLEIRYVRRDPGNMCQDRQAAARSL